MVPGSRAHTACVTVALTLAGVANVRTAGAEEVAAPRAADSRPPSADPAGVPPPTPSRRALAVAGSVLPGVVLHGTGAWLLGDEDAAGTLLLIEGIGIGATLGAGTGLALTGAASATVAPLALLAIGGVGLFGMSLLADIYYVVSPRQGFGTPQRRLPRLESFVGYQYVDERQFEYEHLMQHGVSFRHERWSAEYRGWHAPTGRHARHRASAGYRPWGVEQSRTAADGSFLELQLAVGAQQFEEEEFATRSLEAAVRYRVDSTRIVPSIRGAFAEFHAGVAWRHTRFDSSDAPQDATQRDSVLLGGFAFGTYLGDPFERGGELRLYYDHRHDDFASGLKAEGLGSGVAGHFGLSGHHYFNSLLGAYAFTEIGSAWVMGLGLRMRQR